MQELVLIQPIRAAEEQWSREAAQAAKRREFEERLAECGPLAYRVARGVLRNDADAEDVAQEALLRAYRRLIVCAMRSGFAGGWCASCFGSRWIAPDLRRGARCAKRNGRGQRDVRRQRPPSNLRLPANFRRALIAH